MLSKVAKLSLTRKSLRLLLRNSDPNPNTVSEYFVTNDHSANDIILIPLELTKSNRDSVRKAREAYLIERGKTLEPLGINKKDEM